jgi:uncharacterized glyoxalase superfamily protein PhnB
MARLEGTRLILAVRDLRAATDLGDHSYVAHINVDDVEGLYDEFVSRGVPIRASPETRPWGMREFVLRTPDGHRMTFGSSAR